MRIVAGSFRGRRLQRPADRRVRVTTDRVRESWFAILAPYMQGARVLDLFSGSGILGLEALSRGAETADFVEVSPACVKTVRGNIAALGVESVTRVHRGDALRFAERLPPGAYDIALADPPYTTDQAPRLVAIYRTSPFARILSVEHAAAHELDGDETRRYGDVKLTFCYANLSGREGS